MTQKLHKKVLSKSQRDKVVPEELPVYVEIPIFD